jgi:hypothetical protein
MLIISLSFLITGFYSDEEYSKLIGKEKTMCVVDSGIAFNSPFPTALRPERKVELILSFDFSQRDINGDDEPPFVVSCSWILFDRINCIHAPWSSLN